ncbi:MAG: hypothetical protein ACR2OB_00170 [Solirubrobacteraceae bacterium]
MIARSLALAAVLLMTGAFATPALAAKQTLKFTSVETSQNGPVLKAKDVNAKGKVIGHDVLTCKSTSKHSLACTGVFKFTAPKKGSISVKLKIDFTANLGQGIITGGTGGYAGAKGTIKGRATSAAGNKVKIVLTIT